MLVLLISMLSSLTSKLGLPEVSFQEPPEEGGYALNIDWILVTVT